MKKLLLYTVLGFSLCGFSQEDSRIGITLGLNEYFMDADFLHSKSGVGVQIGVISAITATENSEVQFEIALSRNYVQLLGRETEISNPEWIKFYMDRVNITLVYDYEFIHFLNDDIALGLCAGPALAFVQDFRLVDDSKSDYLFDPYYLKPDYIAQDTYNEKFSINVLGVIGITARYRDFEASLRYHKGLTDNYRNFPAVSQYADFSGKDSFATLNFTYFFGEFY